MAQHTVTAPLVIAKTSEGGDQYLYRGAVVPDGQSDEWLKSHLDMGMIAKGDGPAAGDTGGHAPAHATDDDRPDDDRPAGNASRDAWADYAQAHGYDVTDEMGRDDIRALFD